MVRKIKQRDFKIFADYLFYKGEIIEPTYDESLINKSNSINIININIEDIQRSIEYINKEKERTKTLDNNLSYEVFTQEELEEFFEEVTDKIINFINDLDLEK